MHPILERIKQRAGAAAERANLTRALRPASASARRAAAWTELRADLRAALAGPGTEEADWLRDQLAPEEAPERFNSLIDHHVCALSVPGHAPLQLLLVRQQGRWRPAGPGRTLAWAIGGTMYADLGVALTEAQQEYDRDPQFYEQLLKHHTWDPEPVEAIDLPPGATVDDMAKALVEGGMQEVSPLPGGMRPLPEAGPAGPPAAEAMPWEGGGEIDPHRPSKKKKGEGKS